MVVSNNVKNWQWVVNRYIIYYLYMHRMKLITEEAELPMSLLSGINLNRSIRQILPHHYCHIDSFALVTSALSKLILVGGYGNQNVFDLSFI